MHLMRISSVVLATVVASSAQTGTPGGAGAGSAGPLQTYDVPTDGKPQTTYIVHRVLKPGQQIGRHYHEGVEITQQISGDLELMVEGRGTRQYHAGDSWLIPRETPHDLKNVGVTDAAIAVTYVLDKGAPLLMTCPDKANICSK